MAIEIYDKATAIQKGDKVYYLVKYGSKNSFTLGNQSVTDGNFRRKWLTRQTRDSHWNVIAIGTETEHRSDKIAMTYWNGPTSEVYGQIHFGNKKNIALFFAKQRQAGRYHMYERMDDAQKEQLDPILEYGEKSDWTIHLSDIPENKKMKDVINYCGNETKISQFNSVTFCGQVYWDLENL